jgi:hypothetical protein
MTLTGILKQVLLVMVSVMISHTHIALLQFVGYSIALAGLVYYSLGWDQIVTLSSSAWIYARGVYESVSTNPNAAQADGDAGRLPVAVRRGLIIGGATIVVLVLFGGFFFSGGLDAFATESAMDGLGTVS